MKVNVKYGQRSRHRPRPRGPGMAPQPHRAGLSQGPGHAARDATWSHTWSDLTCIPHTYQTKQDPVRQLNIIFTCTLLIRTRGESMILVLSLDWKKYCHCQLSINQQSRSHMEWTGLKSGQVQERLSFHPQRLQDYAIDCLRTVYNIEYYWCWKCWQSKIKRLKGGASEGVDID